MGSIRNLFTLKKTDSQVRENEEPTENREQIRITYYQSGWAAALKASGKPLVLKTCLENVYNQFEDQCKRQAHEQQKLKQPYVEEQERQRTELKKKETAKIILEDQKKANLNEIDTHKSEISEVQSNPKKFGIPVDKRPKAQFYIGLLLLLPITIYLLVFYISASYSAFFKQFSPEEGLVAAIFDANALSKAINDGWLEAVFVGTIPFVFMGLGYLVHMFQKSEDSMAKFKLAALFVLTFAFDVILAYLIERKLFEFERVLGENFSPSIAVTSVNFWGIIFAGFVVYVIWGLVFDFVMKEHENVDKIKLFINGKKNNIKELVNKNTILTAQLDELRHDISDIQGKINELQTKIDGFIFPVKEYLHYYAQYKEGWYQAIGQEIALAKKEKDELLDRCENACQEHLEKMKLNENNPQNVIYHREQVS